MIRKSNGHNGAVQLPITRDELRSGWTSEMLERFYRDTLPPPQYWEQIVRCWGQREKELYAALAAFEESHHSLARSDLTPLAEKELQAIEADLTQATRAKRHAADRLAGLSV